MVYILGTRNREYSIENVLLPKKEYNEREIELGRKSVVEIDDVTYARLASNKIFKALVASGDILVRDKPPEGRETMPELRQKLLHQSDESSKRIAELMDELEKARAGVSNPAELVAAKKELDDLRKEAIAEIGSLKDRITVLEQAIVDQGGEIPE